MGMRFRSLVLTLGVLALFMAGSSAQDIPDRIKSIQDSLNSAKAAYDQLPDDVKQNVKPDRRLFQFNDAVNRIAPGTAQGINANWQPSNGWDQGGADENGLVQVNNPARDRRFSPFFGYTQNSATTARCSDSVVVAFNDSGSFLETLLTGTGGVSFTGEKATGTGGLSFSGVASSNDGGETFHDRGAVPPGPNVSTWLMGQPSVACSDRNNFFMVQEARFASGDFVLPIHGIALSRSSDGGATWGDPVTVISTPVPTDAISDFENPRIAVDPSNHQRVYIAYAHQLINQDCLNIGIPAFIESRVELLVSNDGGQTFDPNPTVMDDQCSLFTGIVDLGVRMAISSDGVVYVAWQSTSLQIAPLRSVFLDPDSIQLASVAPTGRPSPPVAVDFMFPLHGFLILEPTLVGVQTGGIFPSFFGWIAQGGFFNEHGFDLAVDRSKGPTNGNVYVAWNDGRNGAFGAFELEDQSLFFAYSFTDILVSVSSDGGQTFTPSQQLNSDLQPTKTRGHDHFRPVLAVDKSGSVAACWYDRRNDPQNFQFERFCAESKNGGSSWREFSIPGSLSTPSVQEDWLVGRADMGQNDDLTTDFNGHVPGFLGGIQWMSSGMNPDIKLAKFQ